MNQISFKYSRGHKELNDGGLICVLRNADTNQYITDELDAFFKDTFNCNIKSKKNPDKYSQPRDFYRCSNGVKQSASIIIYKASGRLRIGGSCVASAYEFVEWLNTMNPPVTISYSDY